MDRRAGSGCLVDGGADGGLGPDDPGTGFEDSDIVIEDGVLRIAAAQLIGIEGLDINTA